MRKTKFKPKTPFHLLALCFIFMLASCTHGIKNLNSCDDIDFPLENVFKSTVFVDGQIIDKKTKKVFFKYTGSGGVVWQGFDSTIVMTAAHVCDAERSLQLIRKTSETPEDVSQVVKIHDRDNRVYPVISYVAATEFDLCMMHVSKIPNAPAIKIASEEPEVGDAVFNIASPIGIFSSDGSPMFKGYYSGDYKILNISQEKSSLFSLPAAPGSSGSLLLNKNQEVIGVVSAVYVRFHHLTISPTVKQIRTLMAGKAKTRDKLFISFDPPIVAEEKTFLWGKEGPDWNPKEIDIYIVP